MLPSDETDITTREPHENLLNSAEGEGCLDSGRDRARMRQRHPLNIPETSVAYYHTA